VSDRNFLEGAYSGKLYVTKSVLSNGIGRLCTVNLHLFFPSVKFLLFNCQSNSKYPLFTKVEMSCFLGPGFYDFISSYL
jgi:hypothetical protein